MRTRISNILFLIAALGTGIKAQQEIVIDITEQYQTMQGFGASDAWNVDYVGKYWSEEAKNTIAEKLFSRANDPEGNPLGIGLSRWRFNIGAGSAEQGDASNIEMTERRVECFLNKDSSYNWDKQEGQQWFLEKAAEYGVEKLVAFLNSPPRFYTKNGRANSDNTSRGGPTNLMDDYYDDYAEFITTVLKHFSDSGLSFTEVSPVNEPQWEWNSGQEGCPWQNMEIKTLAGALNQSILDKGLDTRILVAEAGSYDYLHQVYDNAQTSDQIWCFFNQVNPEYLGNYTQVVYGISGHSYWTDGSDAAITSARQNINREAGEQGNIALYQTEYNLLSNSYNTKMENTIFLAKMIYADLVIAGVSAWDYWTALERERWSQLNRFYLIRLIPAGGDYADLTSGGSVNVDKNLWALGHFSRFIRPGYKRVKVTGASDLGGLMATGFVAPDSSGLVLVYINWDNTAKSVTHHLSNLHNGDTFIEMLPYITNSQYSLSRQTSVYGGHDYVIPPRSIVTLTASLDNENLGYLETADIRTRNIPMISPNPTQGSFTVRYPDPVLLDEIPVQLYTSTGYPVYSCLLEAGEKEFNVLQGKPAGIYFIKIGNRTLKILKVD